MTFVYIAPPPAPPVNTTFWARSDHEWVGWNGDTFRLSDWRSGVFLTQAGTEGMGMPSESAWVRTGSPFVHGQSYSGGVVEPRRVFWPVYLFADGGSAEWQELDTKFWQTMHFGRPGTWRVTTSAGTRELRCRFVSDGGHSFARDPHKFGWQSYGVELVADDPFWTASEPVEKSWGQEPPVSFYGGGPVDEPSLGAPPFAISAGTSIASAEITNPGDVEAWVLWSVTGPASNIRLGVGGREVTFPGELLEGQTLTINTDPQDQLAYRNGVDVTDSLGSYQFAPIPAAGSTKLDLSLDGPGTVKASFVPRYFRAW
ncbi:hypothetical protein GGQ69_000820 [Micrococcus sp. TA1]|nr:hypothetical protein [Micrococcus sp. TA1]